MADNASGDDSQARIAGALRERGWERWARLVASPHNGGFAAGNNVGIAALAARHYFLLNKDTLVRPGGLSALLEAADAHPQAAVIGCRAGRHGRVARSGVEPRPGTRRHRGRCVGAAPLAARRTTSGGRGPASCETVRAARRSANEGKP